jgi:VWFA-related protein
MRHRVLSIVLAVLCCTTDPAGQQPRSPGPPEPQTPTFKLQVEYVELDVRVTDAKGNFVRNLTQDDFQVLEDGNPQTITAFSLVDIPIEPSNQPGSPSAPIERVESNERRFDGRMYAMILDDLNTHPDRTARTKNAARRFIERHLGGNDLMAVVFTQANEPVQEFTSDKRLLLAAVDKFVGQEIPERTVPQPIGPAAPSAPGADFAPSEPVFLAAGGREAISDGRQVMRGLTNVAAWLDGIAGRKKAVILISDGFPYELHELALDTRPGIGRTNLNVYAVDTNQGGVQTATSQLTMLTENAGGFVVMDNNQIGRGFDRIVAENSIYYQMAYYPSHPPRDGKFHSIDVRVKRNGVTVRSRRGYTSPKGDPPATRVAAAGRASSASIEALNSPVELTDLGMRVFATPYRAAAQTSVVVGIELVGRDLPLDTGGTVEVSYLAVDSRGDEHGRRTDRLNLNLEAELRARAEQSGVRVLKRMDLPPGRYRLHVAAHDPVRNLSGSLIQDLEVPDPEKANFAVSGVFLMSRAGATMVTAHADEQIKTLLPAPPVGIRSFPQDDEVAVFAELYDDASLPPHRVEIVTTVRSEDGTVVFERAEERESSELQGTGGAYRLTTRIPLENLDPGSYVLTLEASSSLDADLEVSRRVPFTVTAVEPAR